MTVGPPCETGKPWRREANDVGVGAEFVCRPKDVCEIIKIIEWAEAHKTTVRAVGVGHSYSDVVESTGIIIDMSEISGVVGDIDDSNAFVWVRAGTSIKELNETLGTHKLAIEIMGSYDAQHIAGAVSTGTHGSGRRFGPIESQVVALKILTARDKTERELQRDDADPKKRQEFLAAVISMGCAGIITEMKLRVVSAYKLFEKRVIQDWGDVRKEIQNGTFDKDWDHAEVAVDPYPTGKKKKRTCLVTKRRRPTAQDLASKPHGFRTGLSSYAAGLSKLLKPFLALIARHPKVTAWFLRGAFKGLAHKGYLKRSDKVLQLGLENEAVRVSEGIEYMFHVKSSDSSIDQVLAVIDELVAIAKDKYDEGKPFLSSPILMRFVKCSDALVAPQWGDDLNDYVVTLEMGVIESLRDARAILQTCEQLMVALRGRPHWGLNFNHYCQEDIKKAYGSRFEEWKGIVRKFNSSRVFDNALTERLGIWPDPLEQDQPG